MGEDIVRSVRKLTEVGRKRATRNITQESTISAMYDDSLNGNDHGASVWAQVVYAGSKDRGTDAHTIATGWINQAYMTFTGEPPSSPFKRDESKPGHQINDLVIS